MATKPKAPKKKIVVLKNPVEKKIESGLKFLFGDKSTATKKKKPGVAKKATPSRKYLPEGKTQILPKRAGVTTKPTPIPSGSLKPNTRKVKPTPAGPKKKPTLDDFLTKGKRPPMKPGLRVPPDYDVIIPGYNDPKTIKKMKKK